MIEKSELGHREVVIVDVEGMEVRTFRDERQVEILIDTVSIWSHCGIDTVEESTRLQHSSVWRECCMSMDYYYLNGYKTASMVVPLRHLNNYLYSIPEPSENLRAFQAWLSIEVARKWEGYDRYVANLVVQPIHYRAALDSLQVLQTHGREHPEAWVVVNRAVLGQNLPLTGRSNKELAAMNLGYQLAMDIILLHPEASSDEIYQAIRREISEHVRLWTYGPL